MSVMEISDRSAGQIIVLALRGELSGGWARPLQDRLEELESSGSPFVLLNFQDVSSIDSFGLRIISEFLQRGMTIRLAAVRRRVREMIERAGDVSPSLVLTGESEGVDALREQIAADEQMAGENRQFPRLRTHLPTDLLVKAGKRWVPLRGFVHDICEGGVFVELRPPKGEATPPEPEAAIDLWFQLPCPRPSLRTEKPKEEAVPEEKLTALQGEIVRVSSRQSLVGCGVHLLEMDRIARDLIAEYVAQFQPRRS